MSRYCLLIFLVFLTASQLSASNEDFIEELLYKERVRFESVSDAPGETVLRMINEGGSPPARRSRVEFIRFIAAPPDAVTSFEVIGGSWTLYRDGKPEGSFSFEESSEIGSFPTGPLTGNGRSADKFRGVGLVTLRLPLIESVSDPKDRRRRGTGVIDEALIRITWESPTEATEEEKALLQRDRYLQRIAPSLVINPNQLGEAIRADEPAANHETIKEWNETLQAALKLGPVLKAEIPTSGVYRLLPEDILGAGHDPATYRLGRIGVFVHDKQVPVFTEGRPGSPFLGDAAISFHVPPPTNPRRPYIPVWIVQTVEDAPEMDVLQTRSVYSTDVSAKVTTRQDIIDPAHYSHAYPYTEKTGRWATLACSSGSMASHAFRLQGVDPTAEAVLTADFGSNSNHLSVMADLSINGLEVGEQIHLNGRGPSRQTITIPAETLREGENVLAIRFPESRGEKAADELVLSWAAIEYGVDWEKAPAGRPIRIESMPEKSVLLNFPRPTGTWKLTNIPLDITDPWNPVVQYSTRRGTTDLFIELLAPLNDTPMDFIVEDIDTARRIPRLRKLELTDLLDPKEGADLLIVTDPRFVPSLGPLIRHREALGLRVKTVDVDLVYNVFDYGRKGSEPIADFIRHVWNQWPGNRLSSVLFVGEASDYWWEKRYTRPGISENMVPVFGFGERLPEIRGDSRYARVSGNGSLPDVEVARISVRDRDELTVYLRKMLTYETSPPAGPWLTRHQFFTDDESDFAEVAERIISVSLNEGAEAERFYLQDFPYENYFRVANRKRSPEMTEAIASGLSRGALTATYLGHGGPNLWSAERIFHYRDLDIVDNPGKFPVMTAGSCDTAWIEYPNGIVTRSIGEQFLTSEHAGCVALFAPLAGTNPNEHDYLLRPFLKAMRDPGTTTVGNAAMYSRLSYMRDRNQPYVPEQFTLLGDPFLIIPRPTNKMSIEIGRGKMYTGEEVRIDLKGSVPRLEWGIIEASVINERGFITAGPVRGHVENTAFELEVQMPPYTAPGTYRLIVHAWNSVAGGHERIEYAFEIIEPEVQLDWTITPEPSPALAAGMPTLLRLKANLDSDYDLEDVLLSIRDVTANQDLTTIPLTLSPGTPRVWDFQVPAPPGLTVVEARADYAHRKGRDPLATARASLTGKSAENSAFATNGRLAQTTFPSPVQVRVSVPLHSMMEKPVSDVSAELRLRGGTEEERIGAISSVSSIHPGEEVPFEFSTVNEYAPGLVPCDFIITATDAAGEPVSQTIPLDVNMAARFELRVVPGSVQTERRDYLEGETVFVTGEISNVGGEIDRPTRVTLYTNVPWSTSHIATSLLESKAHVHLDPPLLPGESRKVRMRWDPPPNTPAQNTLHLIVNDDREIPEDRFSNNVESVEVNFRRLPNLAVRDVSVRPATRQIKVRDVVSLAVSVENDSELEFAHSHLLTIFAEGMGQTPVLIHREHLRALAPGERAEIEASWAADGKRDRLVATVNAEKEYGESTDQDNSQSVRLHYVVPEIQLTSDEGIVSFAGIFTSGVHESTVLNSTQAITMAQVPEISHPLSFSNEFINGNPLPETRKNATDDNLMMIIDGGLTWFPTERPEPASFSFPLPEDDGTVIYDVYFQQLRDQRIDGALTNSYLWTVEDRSGEMSGSQRFETHPWMGRFRISDERLDVKIAPSDTSSYNSILGIEVRPVTGRYSSPWIIVDGFKKRLFATRDRTPGDTSVQYEYRMATGSAESPRFEEWRPIANSDMIPAMPEATFFQWRALLIGDISDYPMLFDVKLTPVTDEKKQLAGASE